MEIPFADLHPSRMVLSIPMYYGMTKEQISYVVEKVNQFGNE